MTNFIGAVLGTTTLLAVLGVFFTVNAMFWGGML